MAEDPIHEYLHARADHESARSKAEQLVTKLQNLVKELEDWENIVVSDVGVNPAFPPDLAGTLSISALDWPSVNAFAQALASYQQARRAMDNAWRRVPSVMQPHLQPPPERGGRSRRRGF